MPPRRYVLTNRMRKAIERDLRDGYTTAAIRRMRGCPRRIVTEVRVAMNPSLRANAERMNRSLALAELRREGFSESELAAVFGA